MKNYEGHTPGPWKRESDICGDGADYLIMSVPNYQIVADLVGHDGGQYPSVDAATANARLIADAPELLKQRDALLEACREIANHKFISYDAASGGIYEGQYGTGVVDGHRACAIIARAAIELCEKGEQ